MEVIILQGISGAGKSSWIKKHQETLNESWISYTYSADFFFNTPDGWKYEREKQGEAHDWCFKGYVQKLTSANYMNTVVYVDNTNTSQYEIAPYYRVAEAFKIPVKIITLHCPVLVASLSSVHKTPLDTINKQYKNLMTTWIPHWWKREIIPYVRDNDPNKTECCLCGATISTSLLYCHCQIGKLKDSDFFKK